MLRNPTRRPSWTRSVLYVAIWWLIRSLSLLLLLIITIISGLLTCNFSFLILFNLFLFCFQTKPNQRINSLQRLDCLATYGDDEWHQPSSSLVSVFSPSPSPWHTSSSPFLTALRSSRPPMYWATVSIEAYFFLYLFHGLTLHHLDLCVRDLLELVFDRIDDCVGHWCAEIWFHCAHCFRYNIADLLSR